MQRRALLSLTAFAAALSLAGCGFQLRKAPDYAFTTLFSGLPESSPLGVELRRSLESTRKVKVITDGQQIRLKGQGFAGAGGAPGDAIVTVHIAKHPYFERDGSNIRLELPITLYEAVLGGKVRVPTLDGAVELAIPANTNGGRTFRLKGKGLPDKHGKGDLLATVRIVLPETADGDLEELLRKLRDSKPYDPRKNLS